MVTRGHFITIKIFPRGDSGRKGKGTGGSCHPNPPSDATHVRSL